MSVCTEGRGRIEVIYGPMFSGKTSELLRRLERAESEGRRVVAAKPAVDERGCTGWIVSHTGERRRAISVANTDDLGVVVSGAEVLGLDEIQFFPRGSANPLVELSARGIRIVAAGLDLDFARCSFGCTSELIGIADLSTHITARCSRCGDEATLTQRIIDGGPAPLDAATVRVGASELYQPRCEGCYAIERKVSEMPVQLTA